MCPKERSHENVGSHELDTSLRPGSPTGASYVIHSSLNVLFGKTRVIVKQR